MSEWIPAGRVVARKTQTSFSNPLSARLPLAGVSFAGLSSSRARHFNRAGLAPTSVQVRYLAARCQADAPSVGTGSGYRRCLSR